VSAEVHRSDRCRHLVLRHSGGDVLPGALLEVLREEGVASGWLRASGVLADVELRAYDPRAGGLAAAHLIAGPVQALSIEGAIGMADGAPSCSLRALLARDGDRGLEVLGGEIQSARAIALEVFVTSLDDVALGRRLDAGAGVCLIAATATPGGTWSSAMAASGREPPPRAPQPAAAPAAGGNRMPQRPARLAVDLDSPVPDPGDLVDHFAFGRCDVVKSDGDRLHLRVLKDGRIKEIALEMLRVTRLADDAPGADGATRSHFKLDRRI
jgi:predicted DNA-binding protein with PD1-like motif